MVGSTNKDWNGRRRQHVTLLSLEPHLNVMLVHQTLANLHYELGHVERIRTVLEQREAGFERTLQRENNTTVHL